MLACMDFALMRYVYTLEWVRAAGTFMDLFHLVAGSWRVLIDACACEIGTCHDRNHGHTIISPRDACLCLII